MASPHAAGALALLASKGFVRNYAGVSGLYSTLVSSGNLDWTDDSGDGIKEPLLDVSGSVFTPVMVGDSGPPANQAPSAAFGYTCSGLACTFDGSTSSDPDGSIASYTWDFGDGASGNGRTVTHTYASGGTFTGSLTVTDDKGAQASTSKSITVSLPPTPIVSLTGSSARSGSRWTATVTVAVTSDSGPLATTASGTWSNGASGSGSCSPTTCTISKSAIRTSTASVTFTVNLIGGSPSFGGTKSITVSKP
jgi:subtilisin